MALMPRRYRKLACLVKTEATYGTDAVPTGAANSIRMKNVSIQPLAGEAVDRDLLLPYLGHQGTELVGDYVQIEGEVEMTGAGGAGTVPAYGPLLRAAGFSETITADVSVDYDLISDAFEAVSIYYNHDGVNHVALGGRANCVLSLVPKQIPVFRFTMMALVGPVTDTALPVVDHSAFLTGRAVTAARTEFSLHGHEAITESLSIDAGNSVETRHLINSETIEITDRRTTGTAVVQAAKLADIDWFAIARNRARGAFELVHGTVAGDIVEITAPAVEIGRPTQGQTQSILNYSLPMMFVPESGNDELKITVR